MSAFGWLSECATGRQLTCTHKVQMYNNIYKKLLLLERRIEVCFTSSCKSEGVGCHDRD